MAGLTMLDAAAATAQYSAAVKASWNKPTDNQMYL
jgi:hypothetical protein